MKKLQLWGYLKIYLQLNVPISTRHCCTLTSIKRMKKPSWTHLKDGLQKCPYFSLSITFTKIRRPSRFFLHSYRILLVETTLESIMFYYTLSVINTMFVSWSALLYDSTAATRTLRLSTTLLSISCGIRLISFLMMPSLVCRLFS